MPSDVALPVSPPDAEAAASPGARLVRRLLPPRDGLARRLGYAVLGVPLGAVYVAVFAGLLASAVLAVYGVGVLLIMVVLMVVRGCGAWERALARRLVSVTVRDAPALRREGGVVRRLRLLVTSGSTWRTLAWLGVRVLVSAAVVATLFLSAAGVVVLLTYSQSYSLGLPRNLLFDLLALAAAAACLLAAVWVLDLSTRGLALVAPTLLGAAAEERIAAMRRASVRAAGRTAVARDLHDTIGHALTASLVQAEAAQRALVSQDGSAPADLDFARQALGHIEDNTRQALAELDRALAVLGDPSRAGELAERPPDLRDVEGLLAGLGDAGLVVDLSVDVDPDDVPRDVSRLAYRVIQEGTTNVLRHAGLAATTIEVRADSERLSVRLRNVASERTPAPPGRNGGQGVAGLRERAEELGGSLQAGPTADGGFELMADLPLRSPRD